MIDARKELLISLLEIIQNIYDHRNPQRDKGNS